eukprot:gene6671-15388_t
MAGDAGGAAVAGRALRALIGAGLSAPSSCYARRGGGAGRVAALAAALDDDAAGRRGVEREAGRRSLEERHSELLAAHDAQRGEIAERFDELDAAAADRRSMLVEAKACGIELRCRRERGRVIVSTHGLWRL